MVIEKLSALLSESPVATVAVDLAYKVVWQNDAFSQRFLCHDALRDILTLEFNVSPVDADAFIVSEDDSELTTKLDHVYRIKKYTFADHSICMVSFESAPQSDMAEFDDTFFAKIFAGSEQPIIVFLQDSLSIKYFNQSFAATVGLPSVYIANAQKSELYAESMKLLEHLEGGAPRKFNATSVRLNGETVFLEVLLTFMRVNGENVLILKVVDVALDHIEKTDNGIGFPFSPSTGHDAAFNSDLLDAQPNPVIIYNSAGNIVKCNPCLLNLLQCADTNEFKAKYIDISRLFVEEEAFMSIAKHGADWYMAPYRNPRKEYRIKLYASDGEPRIFSVLTNVADSLGAEHIVVSLTDVTETVQQNYILMDVNSMLKDQYDDIQLALTDNMATLIQQSKLATMGEMIGVISHQWKQPLNTIGLIAQNVEDMVEDDTDPISHEEISMMMKSIMKHVLFMSETVDNFRDFFRKNTQRLFFPITSAIDSTLNLVAPVLGKSRVAVEHEYPENHKSLMLFGFPNDFKQVLMNVLINGADSINAKIKNGQAAVGSGKIIVRLAKTHKYEATLTISDNGTGLSGDVSENIFKMNFTTKGEAGTGLGLYMSKKIIDSLGGEVSVQNHADGLEFLMRLPIVDRSLSKHR